jgi:hypothetical protein
MIFWRRGIRWRSEGSARMAENIRFEREIDDLLDKEPFVPFTIILTSGTRYTIPGPRRLAMGRSVFWAVPSDSPAAFFRKSQIASIEVNEEPPTSRRGGRRKRA